MKIAICDDEKKLRKSLRHFIEIHLDLKGLSYEIVEFDSGNALFDKCKSEEIDILFLDIEMPGIGGIDTAKALRSIGKKMLIIFITAYPDYVFQGYEVHAFHYILKPYQETKLKEILNNAIEELNCSKDFYYRIEQKSGILRINLSQICYFQSDRRTVYAADSSGQKIAFYKKLDDVESEMPNFFQRVHNRYLVNLNYISKIESGCCICNQVKIPVSRTYRQAFAVAFAQMMLQ